MSGTSSQTRTQVSERHPRGARSARDESRFVVVPWGDEKVEAQVLGVRGRAPNIQLHLALPCEPALPDDGDRVEIDLHVSELSPGAAAYWLMSAELAAG